MADERVLYRGNPSLATIFGSVLLSMLLFVGTIVGLILVWRQLPDTSVRYAAIALVLLPLGFFFVKWIGLKFLTYEITSERVRITKGIFSRRTDELELYRVRDSALIEPFILRLFGAGDILLVTNDAATPQVELKGLRGAKEVREQLRDCIEECRVRKGARVTEME